MNYIVLFVIIVHFLKKFQFSKFVSSKFSLQNGATLSLVNERGNTPLHDAARWSCVDLVHLLLANEAPLNVKNLQGLTPLHMAKVCEFEHFPQRLWFLP